MRFTLSEFIPSMCTAELGVEITVLTRIGFCLMASD